MFNLLSCTQSSKDTKTKKTSKTAAAPAVGGTKKAAAATAAPAAPVSNPLYSAKPKNLRVGGDIRVRNILYRSCKMAANCL